jgi:hypothetical protein
MPEIVKDTSSFLSGCLVCKTQTRHVQLSKALEEGSDDYHYRKTFEIIECLGCTQKSFRSVFEDFENAYPVGEDEWDIDTVVKNYPPPEVEEFSNDESNHVPTIVRDIFRESLLAIQQDALILGGLGLRGTIEAICNDKNIDGRDLSVRISRLTKQGLISSRDAERLHGIRFLGNDAAHEIKRPKPEQITVALKIIRHLLQSVYILEKEVAGRLEILVTQAEPLKELLNQKLSEYKSGDEFPLAKILGRDLRRLGPNAKELEDLLIQEISSGTYSMLSLGKLDHYASSKEMLQHFVVVNDPKSKPSIGFRKIGPRLFSGISKEPLPRPKDAEVIELKEILE